MSSEQLPAEQRNHFDRFTDEELRREADNCLVMWRLHFPRTKNADARVSEGWQMYRDDILDELKARGVEPSSAQLVARLRAVQSIRRDATPLSVAVALCHEAADEIERLRTDDVHSCHDDCQRLACVQRRDIERLRAALAKAYRLWSSEQGRVCQTANEMARVISHALENDPRHEAERVTDGDPNWSAFKRRTDVSPARTCAVCGKDFRVPLTKRAWPVLFCSTQCAENGTAQR